MMQIGEFHYYFSNIISPEFRRYRGECKEKKLKIKRKEFYEKLKITYPHLTDGMKEAHWEALNEWL